MHRCEGYVLVRQVSPDGGLLQASTLADGVPFVFANGEGREVPGAYLEFAQRLPLPQHAHMPVRAPHHTMHLHTLFLEGTLPQGTWLPPWLVMHIMPHRAACRRRS